MCTWCRNTNRYECGPDACNNGGRGQTLSYQETELDPDGNHRVVEGGRIDLFAQDAHPVYFPLDQPGCECEGGTFLEVMVSKSIRSRGGKPEAFVSLTPTRCVAKDDLPEEVRAQMGI